jgi:hypothetical protein
MTFEQKVEMNLHLKEVKVKRKNNTKWIVHFEATINLSTILIMNICFNLKDPWCLIHFHLQAN